MDIKKNLIEKHGYDPKTVDVMVKQLECLHGIFKAACDSWLKTGDMPSVGEFHGYTVEKLMKENGMKYPAALSTLSWIADEGEKAIRLIKRGVK